MTKVCDTCSDTNKEYRTKLDVLKDQAKQKAIDEQKAQAICFDEVSGLFIAEAGSAIRERYQIKEFISAVR